jgi:hypothetical protein
MLGTSAGLLRKAAYGQPLSDHEAAALPLELGKLWASVFQGAYDLASEQDQERWRLVLTATSVKVYPLAKKRLVKQGLTAEQVEKMPVAQVVAMFTLGRYLHWRDEMGKWQALPWPQAAAGLDRAEKQLEAVANNPEEGWPFTSFLPSFSRAGFITTRLDRKLGAMMTIEAVRLYAAAHEGKAPASLDDLTDSPALPDAVTGKAFQYQRTEDGFVITCPAPPQFPDTGSEVYKVTLRK